MSTVPLGKHLPLILCFLLLCAYVGSSPAGTRQPVAPGYCNRDACPLGYDVAASSAAHGPLGNSTHSALPNSTKDSNSFAPGLESRQPSPVYGDRTGNWTTLQCSDPGVVDIWTLTSAERWGMMNASSAWTDAINVHKTMGIALNKTFMESVSRTFRGPEHVRCEILAASHNCDIKMCHDFVGDGTGPAAHFVFNSLVRVHQIYDSPYKAMHRAGASTIISSLAEFETELAPMPEELGPRRTHMINLQSTMMAYAMGLVMTALPGGGVPTLLLLAMNSLLTGLNPPTDGHAEWIENVHHPFSSYMGDVLRRWGRAAETSVATLFNGSDESISTLTDIISEGKLISGASHDASITISGDKDTALQAIITKTAFTLGAHPLWATAGVYPFIADTGYNCDVEHPIPDHVNPRKMKDAWACYQNRSYYLLGPLEARQRPGPTTAKPDVETGSGHGPRLFDPPPGLESLRNNTKYGGVKISDLIIGSVRTYIQNGNTNDDKGVNLTDMRTLEDLMAQDLTTPGVIRIPVCPLPMAYKAYMGPEHSLSTKLGIPGFPCIIAPAESHCNESTFVDQTSGQSPSVFDCRQLTKMIQASHASDLKWRIKISRTDHKILAEYGECKFGARSNGGEGRGRFSVGPQDVIDIIQDSIARFGQNGTVGSKGTFKCKGKRGKKGISEIQDAEWEIFR